MKFFPLDTVLASLHVCSAIKFLKPKPNFMKPILQLIVVALCLTCPAISYSQKAGTIDSSFGTNGSVYLANPNYSLKVEKAAFDANGKLLVLYSEDEYSNTNYSYLTRFNTDGTIDAGFGYGGTGTYNMRDEEMLAKHFVVAPNGRIAIVGQRDFSGDRDLELVVLDANGQLDASFSGDGKMVFSNSSITSETPNGVVIQPDGKIVVAENYFSPSSNNKYGLMLQRVDSAGGYDFSFGTLAYMVSEIPGVIPFFNDIYYSGSRIIGVGGYDSLDHLDGSETLIGVFADSGPDVNYGSGGYWQQHENDAYGSGRNFGTALRLNNGETLSSFNTFIPMPSFQYTSGKVYHNNGINYFDINQSGLATKGIYQQPDGKIVFCGASLNSTPRIHIKRVTSAFSPDNGFAASSDFYDTADVYSEAKAALFSADEKLYVVATAITTAATRSKIKIIKMFGSDAPQISLSGTITPFNSTVGVATAPQTATVNVTAISSSVDVTAPNGFELSLNGTSYTSQINIPANQLSSGSANFFVRFNPAQAGNFTGNITASSGNYSATLTVSGSTPTGVQYLAETNFTLYPNPANQFLEVQFQNTSNSQPQISIVNILGEEVLKTTSVAHKTSFNVSSLAAGFYLLKVGNTVKRFQKL